MLACRLIFCPVVWCGVALEWCLLLAVVDRLLRIEFGRTDLAKSDVLST